VAYLPAVRPFPATAKGRETRQRIVDAAADLIYERGVASVSLDDVGDATGTSKSQLYHYFADKDDLVHAVIDRQEERVLAFHRPQLSSLSSWDDIERWRDAVVEAQAGRGCRSGCPLGSLANELAELDAGAREQLSHAFATWEQLLADGLAGMARAGALRADADPASLALSTMASLQGGLLLAEVKRNARPLEVALDAAIAHIRSFAPGSASTDRGAGALYVAGREK
jgi:TetR/AcrR family transcriptional regulator, transcriptional repressor for nem operon